jgi:predicted RNA methylase
MHATSPQTTHTNSAQEINPHYSTLKALIQKLPDQPETRSFSATPPRNDRPWSELERYISSVFEQEFSFKLLDRLLFTANTEDRFGLSPYIAFACIRDLTRTKRFLEAIDKSLDQILARTPEDQPVRVLDAGCGPLAVLGIYAALKSKRVQLTSLEINPASAQMAQDHILAFKLQDQATVLLTDATVYQADQPYDLIISETMFAALISEHMVPILNNLKKSSAPDGIIIPESIVLRAAWRDAEPTSDVTNTRIAYFGDETDNVQIEEFEAREVITNWTPGQSLEQISAEVSVPNDLSHYSQLELVVATEVNLGHGLVLSGYDSNISKPIPAHSRMNGNRIIVAGSDPATISIAYEPGEDSPWGEIAGAAAEPIHFSSTHFTRQLLTKPTN